jgi:DNA-binding response OmpR family regulator
VIRLAVIDDDSGFVQTVAKRAEGAGWEFRQFASPVPPGDLVAMKLNAVVLDLSLLGDPGWEYLERISGMLPELGIVVCTENSSVAQRVRGLRLGADDWMCKPCHPEEVMAKVEAVTRRRRRSRPRPESGPLVVGDVEIRGDHFQAYVGGESIGLTRKEFELLQLLVESRGTVLEREAIYQRVWGYSMAHGDRSVDVFVRKLRQKLIKRSPGWEYIHTHFGIGYRFEPEDRAAAAKASEPAAGSSSSRSQPFHKASTPS